MKIKRDRNYLIAAIGCVVCTVLSLMGKGNWDSLHWFVLSDVNVLLWLFVAWLFDDAKVDP
jgi:hypothetical protein